MGAATLYLSECGQTRHLAEYSKVGMGGLV